MASTALSEIRSRAPEARPSPDKSAGTAAASDGSMLAMPTTSSTRQPVTSMEDVKAACARLIAGSSQGTAYLVAPELLVTCEHVVRSVGVGGSVDVSFYQSKTPLSCTVEDVNPEADWALLRLAIPIRDRLPLRCTSMATSDARWGAFGFPQNAGKNGIVLAGTVRDPRSNDDRGRVAIQLYCEEAAAARGAILSGGSGSPVVSYGLVIGHLRSVIPDDDARSEMGTVFACPSSAFAPRLPPEEIYQPLDILTLNDSQFEDLLYDILSAEGFKALAIKSAIEGTKKYIEAETVNTNPAGGIEKYKWFCATERFQTELTWDRIEPIVKAVSATESNYLLLVAYSSLTEDCKKRLKSTDAFKKYHLRIEIWEKSEIEKHIYKHPAILRKHFPSRWSVDYEIDVNLSNIHQILQQLISRTRPIWDNYADKRPFTDLIHFTAKQGKPFCDSFDLVGTLSERQRSVLRTSLQVATSLQNYLLRSLNLPSGTFLIPAEWKDHPNEKIMIHIQGERIMREDMREGMRRILTTIEKQHYSHLQRQGVIAASSAWKPWGPEKHITCYVFSFDEKTDENT